VKTTARSTGEDWLISRKISWKSRKYPGNDLENRWVFSRWWNVEFKFL